MLKRLLIGTLSLIFVIIVFRVLHSPNFLLPTFYTNSFKNQILYDCDSLFLWSSRGNLKNSFQIAEIDNRIICMIWKFNQINDLPEISDSNSNFSFPNGEFVSNSWGNDPEITTKIKSGRYQSIKHFLELNYGSQIFDTIQLDSYLEIICVTSGFTIINSLEEPEFEIDFDVETEIKLAMMKKLKDFFIILMYSKSPVHSTGGYYEIIKP